MTLIDFLIRLTGTYTTRYECLCLVRRIIGQPRSNLGNVTQGLPIDVTILRGILCPLLGIIESSLFVASLNLLEIKPTIIECVSDSLIT